MEAQIEHQRFKQIREELGYTQAEFGNLLGLNSGTADIEYGKTRITGKIVKELLKQFQINPLWLYGESSKKNLNPERVEVMPKLISVNQEQQENILLVPAKAAAGYGQNIGDPQYMQDLPAFTFPLSEYRNASFRGFQIMGDSMIPLVYSGDWVLAKAVNDFNEVVNNEVYIVVESDSIRLKKILKSKDGKFLELISLNPEYPPTSTLSSEVLEMWHYHSKISFGVEKIKGLTLEKVYNEVVELKDQIERL